MLRLRSYTKIVLKHKMLALGVCLPQPCFCLFDRWLQVFRVKITFTVLPTNRLVSTTKKSIKCVVNWIPLRIRVLSRNTQPHLKAGLGFFRNKSANSVESSFQGISSNSFKIVHSNSNVIVTWQTCGQRRHGCGKKTPSAGIFFPYEFGICSQHRKVARFVGRRHFSLQVPKSCTDLDPTLFHISILET